MATGRSICLLTAWQVGAGRHDETGQVACHDLTGGFQSVYTNRPEHHAMPLACAVHTFSHAMSPHNALLPRLRIHGLARDLPRALAENAGLQQSQVGASWPSWCMHMQNTIRACKACLGGLRLLWSQRAHLADVNAPNLSPACSEVNQLLEDIKKQFEDSTEIQGGALAKALGLDRGGSALLINSGSRAARHAGNKQSKHEQFLAICCLPPNETQVSTRTRTGQERATAAGTSFSYTLVGRASEYRRVWEGGGSCLSLRLVLAVVLSADCRSHHH